MRILNQEEVDGFISRGRNAPEHEITAILDELEKEHPGVYRVIYGEPSDAIATINKDMANLYLNLSFDVVWVFKEAFGKPPDVNNEEQWVYRKLTLIDAELKSITKEVPMNAKFRRNLQKRFVKTSFGLKIQLGLLQYLEGEVVKYASFNKKRATASHLTNNLLFDLVRLKGELYNLSAVKSA